MKKKWIGIALLVVCISALTIKLTIEHNKHSLIDEITTSLLKDEYFSNHISNPKASFKDDTIIISFQLHKSYNLLPTSQKYMLLDIYSKQIRYFLRNSEKKNTLHDANISLEGNIVEYRYTYKLTSTLPHKNEFLKPDNSLFLNDKEIYNTGRYTSDFKNTELKSDSETINGYKHTEILSYAERLYNTMTKRGKNFIPQTDSLLIIQAILDEFDISFEEYDYIYKKNILNIH